MSQTELSLSRPARVTERLQQRFFRAEDHPYRIFQAEIRNHLTPDTVLLDAGCGRSAEVLQRFAGRVRRAVGVDLVEFEGDGGGETTLLVKNDLSNLAIREGSVDVVISRSVFEHLADPLKVYREFSRVLKPGGTLIFLTPNLWDYASLCSRVIPNKFHPAIVQRVEGRAEQDTFPVFYRANTASAIRRLAAQSEFRVEQVQYLGQYPCYLMFNAAAFLIGTVYEKIISGIPLFAPLRGWILAVLTKLPAVEGRG